MAFQRKICVPIVAATTEEALEKMQQAHAVADLLEVRVDYIKNPDIPKILAAKQKPVIITITPENENGRFTGTEEDRVNLLREAIKAGADYIDINLDCPERDSLVKECGSTKSIVSYHNYSETPADLDAIYRTIRATGADIIKIATFAKTLGDTVRMLDLVKSSDHDIIGLCMDGQGEVSRILGPLYGSYLTFGSLIHGQESAPGQIPAAALKDIYNIHSVAPDCRLFGLIGNPVSKSKGYKMFNTLFKKHAVNGLYLNFQVIDLDDFIKNVSGMLAGFSITMPHKQAIIPYLDEVDPVARKIGAVNTVCNRSGKLYGCNTDLIGVLKPLSEKTEVRDKNVTLLGAGGAARAIAVGIIEHGGNLTILNRTVAKAEALAGDLNCNAGPLSDFDQTPTDILINMTAVGMHPDVDRTPVDPALVKDMVVFDGIYNPEKTRLLMEAEKNGCTVICGTEMFVNQAAAQYKLWTGSEPDYALAQDIVTCN